MEGVGVFFYSPAFLFSVFFFLFFFFPLFIADIMQVEVGNQGMPALVHVLKTDRGDAETVNAALEALSLVTAARKVG